MKNHTRDIPYKKAKQILRGSVGMNYKKVLKKIQQTFIGVEWEYKNFIDKKLSGNPYYNDNGFLAKI